MSRYFCPSCGIEKGHAHGTGDCGCGVGFVQRVDIRNVINKPNKTGYWVEYVLGIPRKIIHIMSLDQEFPSSSRWLHIPSLKD